jgi:glycosyltransferase involved in cell wall biosynthesis
MPNRLGREPTARPRISLLITTYNWEAALDRVLASVHVQRVMPDEVIVADDGSGPATREIIQRWARRLAVPLRHVWQEDRGFRLAASRNRALAVARGDYIVMIDGDMILHRDFVDSHARFARPGSYVRGSRVLVRAAVTRRILAGETVRLHPFSRGIANRVNAIHWPALASLYRGVQGPIGRGCNMAYWLADARRVNGFNEDIESWGYEDIEFAARLQNTAITRRDLKFGGVAYHLHHKAKQEDPHANREFLERVAREHLTWCSNGLKKYVDLPSKIAGDAWPNR